MQATIQPNTVVTLNYRVADPEGNVLDEGNSDLQYIHGGYEDIFPKIEEALNGKAVGDSVTVTLAPEDAFGLHDDKYVITEHLAVLPPDVAVGAGLEGPAPDDEDAMTVYRVTEIKDGKAVLDANHPLAGKTLIFACSPVAIRAVTDDEIATQTVGGCCGDSECGSCPCGETVH
jgi:FKBP-type peptidyl-prolyl cis-trans isomerase SlyD